MYFVAAGVPPFVGYAGWVAAAASLGVAAWRFGRSGRLPPFAAFVGVGALVAGLRLLEFPVASSYAAAGGILAVAFAALVFGPEAAAWALAAATVARGLICPRPDAAALGFNLALNVALAPWLVAWGWRVFNQVWRGGPAPYVIAFVVGAAGAAVAAFPAALAAGFPGLGVARAVVAALTVAAAEAVLAAWGYALALGRDAAAPAARWTPSRKAGWALLGVGVILGAAVAPLPPAVPSAVSSAVSFARFPGIPWAFRAAAGFVTVGVASLLAALGWAFLRLVSLVVGWKKDAPARAGATG
jgi:hypothetical protein